MKRVIAFAFSLFCFLSLSAQKPNWHNLDLQQDSVFGISTEKAYREILTKKKKFKPVVVAVIDGGVDTAHEDLRSVIWTNPKEVAGNGVDDDQDGYTDDMHGWDFIGGSKGDVNHETLELTRLIRKGQATPEMLEEYHRQLLSDQTLLKTYRGYAAELDSLIAHSADDSLTRSVNRERKEGLNEAIDYFQGELDYHLNLDYNPRPIVGDDTSNAQERFYGNNDVMGPDALHATHVSGIIGAVRDNHIGMDGIANHVWIMSVRTVPDGDERDKDVANAIRFAADHGARVINMSFGKAYSPDKKVVDEAVKYAVSKDVLLVHAAGNEGNNLDHSSNYPNRIYADSSGQAAAWIEVGASSWRNDSNLVASFSNYGKTTVDVFAPGVKIHSTLPGSQYGDESGTSMASPVVAGLAALIREYYPKLSAVQVKEIIMKSVTKPTQEVKVRDGDEKLSLPFSDVCISGGVVNTYEALKLAASY